MDKPSPIAISYTGKNRTQFRSYSRDLSLGVEVIDAPKSFQDYSSDLAEFIAFHAINIRPTLTDFQGYECLIFILLS